MKAFLKTTRSLMTFLFIALLAFILTKVNVKAENEAVTSANGQSYTLADELTEFDFLETDSFQSQWGNQEATLVYNNDGSFTAKANQQIDSSIVSGSYHTKFNVTIDSLGSGNIWSWMLRQNSGDERTTIGTTGKAIDKGASNGYEILTADSGFQFFQVTNGTRSGMLKWFAFDSENNIANHPTYAFEIWVLNLVDGTVQFVINVNGDNKLTLNTSDNAFDGLTPVLNGSFRISSASSNLVSTYSKFAAGSIKANEVTYSTVDKVTEFNFLEVDSFQSTWGNQDATLVYNNDGSFSAKTFQRIDSSLVMGSYHTKFNITVDIASPNLWTWMLRQNSGTERKTIGTTGKTIDDGTSNGYEILTNDNGFQFFQVTNGTRSQMLKWFAYDSESKLASNPTYAFEIWVLNLADGTVQFVINVNGENKLTLNTSDNAFDGLTPVYEGSFRISDSSSNMAATYSEYKIDKQVEVNKTTYKLADDVYELDFIKEGEFYSQWGNQPATLSYAKNGVMNAMSNQQIDGATVTGSYHTKFRVTLESTNANFWTMMLRQNSGAERSAVNGTTALIDKGAKNGYEIFTSDQGFQLYQVTDGTRSDMVKWFAYDDADHFKDGGVKYDFEIWVLNLVDGSVQLIINVGGTNRLNINTSDSGFKGAAPVLSGSIRFGQSDSTLQTSYYKYGQDAKPVVEIKDNDGNYLLADALYELEFSKEANFQAAWGNQEATVTFDALNNSMTCKANQEINSVVDTGSYHTKFEMEVVSENANWVSLMLRQSVRTAVNGGTCGGRTGYGIFMADGGAQFFRWDNDSYSSSISKWFQFEQDTEKYGGAVKTPGNKYTFEIWVLNLVDGSVQFIIDCNGANVLNINSATLGDENPILNGYFRISNPGSTFSATYKGFSEVEATETVTGEPVVSYEANSEVDLGTMKVVAKYVNGGEVGVNYAPDKSVVSGLNFRQVGEQKMLVKTVKDVKEYDVTISKITGATYSLKEGAKDEYLLGETYADDIVILRKVGETTSEVKALVSEIKGFDTTVSGKVSLAITFEGETLNKEIDVYEYVIKEGYKAEYLVGATYANDIVVLKKHGESVEEIVVELADITGFSTEASGVKTLTFSKGIDFSIDVTVAQYTLSEEFETAYEKGAQYLADIKLTKKVGETETELSIALADITGFDTATSGIKVITINKEQFTQEVEIEVYEYVIQEGYKEEYEVGEAFISDIKVIRQVGTIKTEVKNVTVTGFDSSSVGDKELTLKFNNKELKVTIKVKEKQQVVTTTNKKTENQGSEKPAEKKGCNSSVTLFLLPIALISVISIASIKRREE